MLLKRRARRRLVALAAIFTVTFALAINTVGAYGGGRGKWGDFMRQLFDYFSR